MTNVELWMSLRSILLNYKIERIPQFVIRHYLNLLHPQPATRNPEHKTRNPVHVNIPNFVGLHVLKSLKVQSSMSLTLNVEP